MIIWMKFIGLYLRVVVRRARRVAARRWRRRVCRRVLRFPPLYTPTVGSTPPGQDVYVFCVDRDGGEGGNTNGMFVSIQDIVIFFVLTSPLKKIVECFQLYLQI